MRIAIIGGGVAGLSAAWSLSKNNQVVLYEAESRLGGHANTLDVDLEGVEVPVDAGFIVYNEQNYPNIMRLFDALDVRTQASDMSFAVSIGNGRFEYGGGYRALVAQPSNLMKPSYIRMLLDLKRFYGEAGGHLGVMADARFQAQAQTIEEYLIHQGYSKDFAELHLLPMAAAIWSSSTNQIRQFPAESFIRFYQNHGLLNIFDRPEWRTVSGGSRNYVRKIAATISEQVRLGCPVMSVDRSPAGVIITDKGGHQDHFDQLVLATHADSSLRMLGAGASTLERKILGGFTFQPNAVIIHTDGGLMPRRRSAWSSWNYLADDRNDGDRLVSLTYWMNLLQNLKTPRPLLISLNSIREPAPELVLGRITYRHPLMNPDTMRAQGELPGIQGHQNTWHCGAWCGHGFHEDGAQAGLAVAAALGSPAPWQDKIVAISPAADITGEERLQGVA